MKVKKPDYLWLEQVELTQPLDFARVQVAREWWWLANDRGQVAFFRDRYTPMGNQFREVGENFLRRGLVPGATRLVQIPLAFVPLRTGD